MANRIEFETYVSAAGFKKGMMEMEAAANATNQRLQNLLRTKITAVETRMAGMDPNSWEYVQANQRKLTLEKSLINVQNAMYLRQALDRKAIMEKEAAEFAALEEAKTALLAKEASERAAILKAEQLSMLSSIAKSGGGGMFGGGHGGGLSGIIRESLVIVREISMGRGMGRIAGSITLLAQYMGLLGTVVKSTATDAIRLAAADEKVAQSMARTALQAEAKTIAIRQAAIASGASAEAAQAEAASQQEVATAYREAAVAAATKAAATQEEADISAAAATVTLGPIGWIALAVLAVGAAIFFLYRHIKNANEEFAKTAERMGFAGPAFKDMASAIEKATDALREHAKWLEKVGDDYETIADLADEAIRVMEKQNEIELDKARNRGASPQELHDIEARQLSDKVQYLRDAQSAAAGEAITAKLKEESAFSATQSPEEIARQASIAQGKKGMGETADIIDDLKSQLTSMYGKNFIDSLNLHNQFGGSILGGDQTFTSKAGGGFTGTLNQAMDQFQSLSSTVSDLVKKSDALATAEDDAKTSVQKTSDANKKLSKELQNAITDYTFFLQKPVENESKKSRKHSELSTSDSLIRVGNFLGTSRSGIQQLAYEQLKIARESLVKLGIIANNTGYDEGAHHSGS